MSNKDECILKVEEVTVNRSGQNVLDKISFTLDKGDCLAITGSSGSGKTMLGLALANKIFYSGSIEFVKEAGEKILWVEQQHHFKNLQHTSDLYYQQRFNSYDTEETETVMQSIGVSGKAHEMFREMEIEYLKEERLIQLSNGENKKLQLVKARLEEPSVIILDQPFIGLDKDARSWLHKQFEILKQKGLLVIIITSPEEIPGCVSKVLSLEEGKLKSLDNPGAFRKRIELKEKEGRANYMTHSLPGLITSDQIATGTEPIIEMNNVTVQYGDKIILDSVNWKVMVGERWLLSGANGAGKSTLLSLITADNPKGYANSIFLFGKKRGTGESIWDIKKRIGFISPELHLYFDQASTCFETVASGLFDTIGLFRQLSDEDAEHVNQWMDFGKVKHLRQKRLYELSLGEQRAVLLVRSLVKDPPLLVLDEPCQGLDSERKNEFIDLINQVCIAGNKTMIFVSHYENDRPACISRFIKLDHGKAVEVK